MSFFSEFRRRNVPQVALAYLAGAWLLLQVVDTVFPLVGLDEKAGRITGQQRQPIRQLARMAGIDRKTVDAVFDHG